MAGPRRIELLSLASEAGILSVELKAAKYLSQKNRTRRSYLHCRPVAVPKCY